MLRELLIFKDDRIEDRAMSLIRIKVVYSYYFSERVTSLFLSEEDLSELTHDAFKNRIINEIPHLRETTDKTTVRLTVLDQGYQVDISEDYFQHQI